MTVNGYSRELYEHHSTQLRHQEADLRALQTLLDANEHQLRSANASIRELRDELVSCNAWLVLLQILGFTAGCCVTILVRSVL